MQTEVTDRIQAVEGLQANSIFNQEVVSRFAYEKIYVGKAICPTASTQVGPNLQKVKLPASAADVARCEGVALFSESIGQVDNENYASYAANKMLPMLKEGEVWVVSANSVTDLSKPVHVRRANGNLTQVFTLTVQSGAAASKVYSFNLIGPTGVVYPMTHTAVDADEDKVATAFATAINAVTGIGATASTTVVTCTAANADERWQIRDLVVADIVLAGETTPTAGTLGSFRSGADTAQVQTITLADTAAASKLYPITLKSNTGIEYSIVHTASGADETVEATAIAALINALTGLGATAASNVVTVTAADLDVTWTISANADMAVAETTVTDYTLWDRAEFVAAGTIGGIFMAKLRMLKND